MKNSIATPHACLFTSAISVSGISAWCLGLRVLVLRMERHPYYVPVYSFIYALCFVKRDTTVW